MVVAMITPGDNGTVDDSCDYDDNDDEPGKQIGYCWLLLMFQVSIVKVLCQCR